MKRLLLILAMATPLGLVAAGNENKPKHPLTGVWQQMQTSQSDGHAMLLPVWKVMQADGTFCTFLIANQTGQSIITNQGRYEVTSDSTLVETVSGSITDPELVGKGNRLTYTFKNKDTMHVSYRMPGASHDGHEDWVRVKLELPK